MSNIPHLWAFTLVPTYSWWGFLAPLNAPLCSQPLSICCFVLGHMVQNTFLWGCFYLRPNFFTVHYPQVNEQQQGSACVCLSVCLEALEPLPDHSSPETQIFLYFLCAFCTLMKLSPVSLQSPIDITVHKHPTVGTSAPHMYVTHWQTGW